MGPLHLAPLLSGFGLGISLIAAIGAQNAFILRQGLMRAHVFVLCSICALADALLIIVGVAGLGSLVARSPVLITGVTVGGALFLLGYAAFAFRRALSPGSLEAARAGEQNLRAAVMACLAFTFLNPHVYLDTVVLLGGLSAGFEGWARLAYGAGAVTASFAWFFALG
jgi:L-lysine exporter family protein LysE/ArgO